MTLKKTGRALMLMICVILVISVAGCLGGTRRTTSTEDGYVTGPSSLVIGLVQDGGLQDSEHSADRQAGAPGRFMAPRRSISGLSGSDITVYTGTSTLSALNGTEFGWCPDENRIRIHEAEAETYTVQVGRAARFSVPVRANRSTFAEATLPDDIELNDVGMNGGHVRVGMRVAEFRPRTNAASAGTDMAYYRYISETRAESSEVRLTATVTTSEDVALCRWGTVEVSATATAGADRLGNLGDAETLLTGDGLPEADYSSASNIDELEFILASDDALMKVELSRFAGFLGALTGQTISTTGTAAALAERILGAVEKTSKSSFEIENIVVLTSADAVNNATVATTDDEELDYGDDAYFVIITDNMSNVPDNAVLKVSAVINGSTTRNAVWADRSRTISISQVEGQNNVWGGSNFRLPVTVANISEDGMLDITFSIEYNGIVDEQRKTFSIDSDDPPAAPELTIISSAASQNDADIPSSYEADTVLTMDRNIFLVIDTDARAEGSTLYLDIGRKSNPIFDALELGMSLLPDLSEESAWDDTEVSSTAASVIESNYGIKVGGYRGIPLADIRSGDGDYDIEPDDNTPGLKLYYDTGEEVYIMQIIKPDSDDHACMEMTYSAYIISAEGVASDEAEGDLTVLAKTYAITSAAVNPAFELYWGVTDEISAAAEPFRGTLETGLFYLYVQPVSTVEGTANTPGFHDLMFYIEVREDGTLMDDLDGIFIHAAAAPNAGDLNIADSSEALVWNTIGATDILELNISMELDEDKEYAITVMSMNVLYAVDSVEVTFARAASPAPGTVVVDFRFEPDNPADPGMGDLNNDITSTGLPASTTLEIRILDSDDDARWPVPDSEEAFISIKTDADRDLDLSGDAGEGHSYHETIIGMEPPVGADTEEVLTIQVRTAPAPTAFRSAWAKLSDITRMPTPDSSQLFFCSAENVITGEVLIEDAWYYVFHKDSAENGLFVQAEEDGDSWKLDVGTHDFRDNGDDGLETGQEYRIRLMPSEPGKLTSWPSVAKGPETAD